MPRLKQDRLRGKPPLLETSRTGGASDGRTRRTPEICRPGRGPSISLVRTSRHSSDEGRKCDGAQQGDRTMMAGGRWVTKSTYLFFSGDSVLLRTLYATELGIATSLCCKVRGSGRTVGHACARALVLQQQQQLPQGVWRDRLRPVSRDHCLQPGPGSTCKWWWWWWCWVEACCKGRAKGKKIKEGRNCSGIHPYLSAAAASRRLAQLCRPP